MAALTKGVFVVAAKRTAFGAFGGSLKGHTATDLAEVAAKAALAAGNVKAEAVDTVVMGNVCQTSKDGAYLPRHMAIRVGVPNSVPAFAVNRLCGSGFQAIINGTQEILLGDADIAMVGGAENMSQAPYIARNIRFGIPLGVDPALEDSLWATLTDQQIKMPMGITAENLAAKYNITREECDAFACHSQQAWGAGHKAGAFKEEIVGIPLKTKKGEVMFDTDEHPRPDAKPEQLAKLKPVFKKDGTVNAGNASGICDGASVLLLASEAAVSKHNLTPLARLVGYGVSGCDPTIMGIGPVPAVQKMLKATGTDLATVDLVEVNEAFAPQYLAVEKELGLDRSKTNVNGGAIALGHPVGTSGARITGHLVHELRRRGLKTAVGSACIGGGQGIAVQLERV